MRKKPWKTNSTAFSFLSFFYLLLRPHLNNTPNRKSIAIRMHNAFQNPTTSPNWARSHCNTIVSSQMHPHISTSRIPIPSEKHENLSRLIFFLLLIPLAYHYLRLPRADFTQIFDSSYVVFQQLELPSSRKHQEFHPRHSFWNRIMQVLEPCHECALATVQCKCETPSTFPERDVEITLAEITAVHAVAKVHSPSPLNADTICSM